MHKIVLTAAAIAALFAVSAQAADPIVGNWRTESGETANIAPCGDNFCVVLKTGNYAGKNIGSLINDKGNYTGKVTDPATDKTYRGKASIDGSSMKMSGCVLGGLICQSQTWTKN